MRIAGFGLEKLEGSRKESVSLRPSIDSEKQKPSERKASESSRSKSREHDYQSDLRREHEEMKRRNQELRFTQQVEQPVHREESGERQRKRSTSRTRRMTEIEVVERPGGGGGVGGENRGRSSVTTRQQPGYYGTLRVTTIEVDGDNADERHLGATRKVSGERDARKRSSSSRRHESPDHNFVSYRGGPEPNGLRTAPPPTSQQQQAPVTDRDRKWKADKVPKLKDKVVAGSATSQEDSDEPILRDALQRQQQQQHRYADDGHVIDERAARYYSNYNQQQQHDSGFYQTHPQQREAGRRVSQKKSVARSLSPSSNASSDQAALELQKLQVKVPFYKLVRYVLEY